MTFGHLPDSTPGQRETPGGGRDAAPQLVSSPELALDHAEFEGYSGPSRPEIFRPPYELEKMGNNSTTPPKQRQLKIVPEALKNSIVSKLLAIGEVALAAPLAHCHTEISHQVCTGCSRVIHFWNRCDTFYCPCCAPRLSRERKQGLEWWAKEIGNKKHVVLTVRNSESLTKERVQWFKNAFNRLRRSSFASNWRGGLYSLEVTNEGRGWHLHLHALIDADYIPAGELAREWAKRVGQDFAIVKVKAVKDADYLAEVTKYVVKGDQIAGWTGEQIAEFVKAFSGVRSFGVFGDLYAKRSEFRAFLDAIEAEPQICDCGCTSFRVMSSAELEWYLETNGPGSPPTTTPNVDEQPALDLGCLTASRPTKIAVNFLP